MEAGGTITSPRGCFSPPLAPPPRFRPPHLSSTRAPPCGRFAHAHRVQRWGRISASGRRGEESGGMSWARGGWRWGGGLGAGALEPAAPHFWLACLCRARCTLRLAGPRRWLAGRRGPEGSAKEDPEGEGAIPFSASKASPRVWSVSQSMGSDYQRPWVKVLPLSLLCSGLLLWCAFREKTEIDDRLEALLSGQIVDPLNAAQQSSAPSQLQKERWWVPVVKELPKVRLLKGCSHTGFGKCVFPSDHQPYLANGIYLSCCFLFVLP